jgi:hypothetical protein
LPMSLHQAQVTGLADARERAALPVDVRSGLPVSPVQSLLLTPRVGSGTDLAAKRPQRKLETDGAVLARAATH